jgi:hypothetical protein
LPKIERDPGGFVSFSHRHALEPMAESKTRFDQIA